jgi:hypothetical protein
LNFEGVIKAKSEVEIRFEAFTGLNAVKDYRAISRASIEFGPEADEQIRSDRDKGCQSSNLA